MEHAGPGQVGRVAPGAGHDLRAGDAGGWLPDQPLRGPASQPGVGGDPFDPAQALDELPVGKLAAGRSAPDRPLRRAEPTGIHAPPRGGQADERLAGCCRDAPQELARVGHRPAAERAEVVGAEVGVPHHEPHGIERQAELLGDEQRERRAVVLPGVDLAGERGRDPVDAHVEPGTEAGGPPGLRVRRGFVDDHQALRQDLEVVPLLEAAEVPRPPRADAGRRRAAVE